MALYSAEVLVLPRIHPETPGISQLGADNATPLLHQRPGGAGDPSLKRITIHCRNSISQTCEQKFNKMLQFSIVGGLIQLHHPLYLSTFFFFGWALRPVQKVKFSGYVFLLTVL